jgi:hypothetical protein
MFAMFAMFAMYSSHIAHRTNLKLSYIVSINKEQPGAPTVLKKTCEVE